MLYFSDCVLWYHRYSTRSSSAQFRYSRLKAVFKTKGRLYVATIQDKFPYLLYVSQLSLTLHKGEGNEHIFTKYLENCKGNGIRFNY